MHHLVVSERPVSWKRAGYHAARGYVTAFDRQKMEKHFTRTLISREFKSDPLEGPISLKFIFYLPIPDSTSKKFKLACMTDKTPHCKKPDLDNYLKYILDCMSGLVFVDDAQVWQIVAEKIYGVEPCTEIFIYSGDEKENESNC